MILVLVFVFTFITPMEVNAAKAKKIKLKGLYWDFEVKTANKAATKVELGKTYKVVINNPDLRHEGSYNGIIRFQLPKYAQYAFVFSDFKGNADYMYHILYKKYNYGIGTATFLYRYSPYLCTQAYIDANGYAGDEDYKAVNCKSQAILESKKIHYLYFAANGKCSFKFKIKKVKNM